MKPRMVMHVDPVFGFRYWQTFPRRPAAERLRLAAQRHPRGGGHFANRMKWRRYAALLRLGYRPPGARRFKVVEQ